MVLDVADAVEHGVAHVEVAAREVDLRAQGVAPLLELARAHTPEEVEILLHGAVAPGAHGGVRRVAAVLAELLRVQLAHVGQALFDELDGILVGLLKVVRAVVEPVAPVEAEPVDVVLDGVDVLGILLGGVRIVKTEVADAAEVLGGAEIYGQGLAVSDMQIAVRLGRETGVDLHPLAALSCGQILLHKGLNEVSGCLFHVRLSQRKRYLIINESNVKYKRQNAESAEEISA